MANLQLIFEDWNYIPRYEGMYIISTRGRCKSFDKYVNGRNGLKLKKGKYLRPHVMSRGYIQYELNNKGVAKSAFAHTLILIAFFGERPIGFVGMHLDDIKTNNIWYNLKWGSQSENVQDAYNKGIAETVNKRKVEATNLKTGEIQLFDSVSDVRYKLKAKNVSKVLSGERPHSKNYSFKYLN